MYAAFVDVSPEELQQKNLQSSLETVDVKHDSTDSESKEDTEEKVSYVLMLQSWVISFLQNPLYLFNTLIPVILEGSHKWSDF
jgi:hypothetical protein